MGTQKLLFPCRTPTDSVEKQKVRTAEDPYIIICPARVLSVERNSRSKQGLPSTPSPALAGKAISRIKRKAAFAFSLAASCSPLATWPEIIGIVELDMAVAIAMGTLISTMYFEE